MYFIAQKNMRNILLAILLLLSSNLLLAQSNVLGVAVNQKAPDFSAKDQNGKVIRLKSQLEKGSVVLVFYRGQWCPFCNRELSALEDSLKYISAKGGTVIAVSPEKPENIIKTIEKTKASYAVLHDDGLKIMKSYDVAFQVDSLTVSKYKSYGVDFTIANGEANGANLPIPAVYIINKQGVVTYRYFDKDYRNRPTVKELLKHL
jgi:peroxiredoxin